MKKRSLRLSLSKETIRSNSLSIDGLNAAVGRTAACRATGMSECADSKILCCVFTTGTGNG